MDYDTFINGLLEYYRIYDMGLKKQANKYIEDFVKTISIWECHSLKKVLFRFAKELCDDKCYDFMKRGNGKMVLNCSVRRKEEY